MRRPLFRDWVMFCGTFEYSVFLRILYIIGCMYIQYRVTWYLISGSALQRRTHWKGHSSESAYAGRTECKMLLLPLLDLWASWTALNHSWVLARSPPNSHTTTQWGSTGGCGLRQFENLEKFLNALRRSWPIYYWGITSIITCTTRFV